MKINFPLVCTVGLLYLTTPTILFVNSFLEIEIIRTNLDLINSIQKYQFAITAGIFSLCWCFAFHLYLKEEKVVLHDLAGILGVATAMISLTGLTIFSNGIFSVPFALSGALCIYCISVPTYEWFRDNLKDKKFEGPLLSLVIGTVSLYLIDGYASISLNKIFGVDAQYFYFTKPVAMILEVSPFLALFSLLAIIWLAIFPKNNPSGVEMFYTVNKLSACYVILVLSLAFGGRSTATLEAFANKFDFNIESPCKVREAVNGVIVLDPAHNRILVQWKENNKNEYKVENCILK